MMKRYKEVRKELKKYGQGLDKKEEIIILTKSDEAKDKKEIVKKMAEFSALGGSASGGKKSQRKVFTLSLFDDKMIKEFKKELTKILKGK